MSAASTSTSSTSTSTSSPSKQPKPSSVPSFHDVVDVTSYDAMLARKVTALRDMFATLLRDDGPCDGGDDDAPENNSTEILPEVVSPEVFPSPPKHFRSRCRFQIVAEDGEGTTGDDCRPNTQKNRFSYRLRENGEITGAIETFPMALLSVNEVMPLLLETLDNDETGALALGLEAVHFLAARRGGMHITLLYSRSIGHDETWRVAATRARETMLESLSVNSKDENHETKHDPAALNLLGRSKNVAVSIGPVNYVVEELTLSDGKVLTYHQPEGAFSNPNAFVAEHTVDWLVDVSRTTVVAAMRGLRTDDENENENAATPHQPSLLELFCGNGNHTVALAGSFHAVAAVEISKSLCQAARLNLTRNGIENARVFEAPSEYVARAMLKKRRSGKATAGTGDNPETNPDDIKSLDVTKDSIKSLDVSQYDVVLVDPPRAGLDTDTLALVKQFPVILYISCDPNSLFQNATCPKYGLAATHKLKRFAVFDHFPYTKHVECGAVWVRKDLAV